MKILVDHNLTGMTVLFQGTTVATGWRELLPIQFLTFGDIDLPTDSDDRTVWHFAQTNQMLLLTANRNKKGPDSLEQVIEEEGSYLSLPVITVGNPDRIDERVYREKCVERLVEIIIDIENYLGSNRLFIP